MSQTPEGTEPLEHAAGELWILRQIEQALRGLQYGEVTIIVQDGIVIQVERTERKRLQRPPRKR